MTSVISTGEKTRAPLAAAAFNSASAAFPWIDHEVAVAQDRGCPCDSELFAKVLAIQEAARQTRSRGAPRVRGEALFVEHVAGEVERVPPRDIAQPSSPSRPASASTARRDRRQARTAFSLPILRVSVISGVSISYCTSAVLASVEPLASPRLSTTATFSPADASASAMMRPVIPAPITSTSVVMSRSSRCGTEGARRPSQTGRPLRRFFRVVATNPSSRFSSMNPRVAQS